MSWLRTHRCLLVLDNIETIIEPGGHSGGYLPGYERYGQLLKCLAETNHQSTILLTSREKPKEIAAIEGQFMPIRSMVLTGLYGSAIQDIFRIKGDFLGSDEEWRILVEHYGGNPFALKIVAGTIQDLFDSSIANFIECLPYFTSVFGDIRYLLSSQIERLSDLEKQIIYWLSIERKPASFSELRSDFVPQVSLANLVEALTSLQRRCLLEKVTSTVREKKLTLFTLKPVIMDYMTDRFRTYAHKPDFSKNRGFGSSRLMPTPSRARLIL